MTSVKVSKTYGRSNSRRGGTDQSQPVFSGLNSNQDKASSLFDMAISNKTTKQPTRTSPRKTKSKYSSTATTDISPDIPSPTDPYSFSFSSDSSPDRSPIFGRSDSSKVSPPISEPAAGLEPEESDEDMTPEMSRESSQGSLSGKVDKVHLSTPPKLGRTLSQNSPKRPLNEEIEKSATTGANKKRSKTNDSAERKVDNAEKNGAKARYVHRWDFEEDSMDTSKSNDTKPSSQPNQSVKSVKKFFMSSRTTEQKIESGKKQVVCARQTKELFTVIRNVKDAHQSHNSGENQQYQDDLEFILESLQTAVSDKVKCLSMVSLSKKCLNGEFRQYLRARGFGNKILHAVGEAWLNPSLALCTACVLYLLARDKLSLAVDPTSLKLMLKLMECNEIETESDHTEYGKYREQVWAVLDLWRKQLLSSVSPDDTQSVMFDVTEENLSTNFLATESLVFISVRKPEEWVKRDMRTLGGLEFIVQAVSSGVDSLPLELKKWKFINRDCLKLTERYLRIVEQATFMNPQNQAFLISHKACSLLKSCNRLLEICCTILPPVSRANKTTILSKDTVISMLCEVIRVLCNLSHNNELCCTKLGQMDGFLRLCLQCITHLCPRWVSDQKRFDLLLLVLGLLVNLAEHCNSNRRAMISLNVQIADPALPASSDKELNCVSALVKMFLRHEATARAVDEELDRDLVEADQPESGQSSSSSSQVMTEQELQATIQTVMNKASTHMEDSVAASYVALLLGCLLQQNEAVVDQVKAEMPDGNLKPMTTQLETFLEFMQMTSSAGNTGHKSLTKVLEFLRRLDSDVY